MNPQKIVAITCLMLGSILSFAQPNPEKTYKLSVKLEGAPFDSLFIREYTAERNIFIPSVRKQKDVWEFRVPDSIVWDSEAMELVSVPYDSSSNSSRGVRFIVKKGLGEVIVANVGVEDREDFIYGQYIKESVFPETLIDTQLDGVDTTVIGDAIYDDFLLVNVDASPDLAARIEDPYFAWFFDAENVKGSYGEFLSSYIDIAERHPDARFLISRLATNLKNFQSRQDVRKVYEILSEKHKNSIWSERIEKYLTGEFHNLQLPTLSGDSVEDVVQNVSNYNLIVFSASWCVPCLEEIPLLKTIHKDLRNDLVFTFVSMDEKKTVPRFRKILLRHEIPWRTLFAFDDLKKVRATYYVESIPHNILVHPDGKMQIIDVRNESDQKMIYSLFSQ